MGNFNAKFSKEVLSERSKGMLQLMEIGISGAQIIDVADFMLNEVDEDSYSREGVFWVAHPEIMNEIEDLFNGEIFFDNQYSYSKNMRQVVFNLKSHNGFIFAVNSEIIESIKDYEIVKFLKYGFLNIPFFVKVGDFISMYYIKLESRHINDIEEARAQKYEIFDIPEHKPFSLLGKVENGNYIYVWTKFDLLRFTPEILDRCFPKACRSA